jgi:hypothetical protein
MEQRIDGAAHSQAAQRADTRTEAKRAPHTRVPMVTTPLSIDYSAFRSPSSPHTRAPHTPPPHTRARPPHARPPHARSPHTRPPSQRSAVLATGYQATGYHLWPRDTTCGHHGILRYAYHCQRTAVLATLAGERPARFTPAEDTPSL